MANQKVGLEAIFDTAGFNQGLASYLLGINQAQTQTTQAASAINSAGSAIASGFGAAMGVVAVDAIKAFVGGARDAVADALGLASAFEQLEFGIRALGASQELLAGSTEDFSQIFAEQKEVAEGYLLLLQDLAIPSIFTTQQLAAGQRMLQVFGFAQDEAFELNALLTNFATAGNLSSETMGRIAYAMGQVKTEGRLLSTEVRQFANAGIPLIDVLAKNLGKTAQQVRADMKEGLITADVVLPALIDYFENFSGVTEESQKTLRGLFSALQDVREISIANFTRAALEPVIPILQDLVKFFTDESIRAGATALGELLGPKLASFLQSSITALQSLFTALTSISPQTATFFALLAGGAVVLTGFAGAVGIISLAMGALVTAFTLPVAAVSAFVAAYATNFGNVQTITNTVVNAVVSTISGAVGGFNDFASGIADALNSAAQAMGDFLGAVADWGSSIVSTLAEGITSAVSVVIDAINVLAEAISYLMAPGSPPRMLPHLTEWGKETANEWLKGWTQADFDILNDITNFVEQALGKDVSANKIIAVNQIIAQAVDEIRKLGQVSQETFGQIQSSLGAASDEVFGYLDRYERLASATTLAEQAQAKLNATTLAYDALLSPLKNKLNAATEAVTRAKEAQEAKGLERLLQTQGVSGLRKQEALARLQQIGARQQVADVESEKQIVVDGLQAELNLATKLKDEAQVQLDLFGQRIQLQNQFIALLEKEQNQASSGGGAAAKAHKEGLSALEKQLKLIQLQQQELQDMIGAAKARKVLEDENATAAQKTAAALELQEIAVRRQLRDIEAAKLGGNLDAIRQIAIVAADLEKPAKGKGKLAGIASDFKVLSDADPTGRLAEFRQKVDEMRESFNKFGIEFEASAKKVNENLPPFLRFWNEEGVSGPPPLLTNLTAALAGFATFKFAAVTTGLLGLGPAGVVAAAGIGAFVAAFQGNWFGIRDTVNEVAPIVRARFEELRAIFQQGFGGGQTPTSDILRGVSDPIDNLTFKIGQFSAKVVEDVGKIGPAFTQMKSDLDAIFGGEGTIFSKLVKSAGVVSEAFGENSAARLALGAFTTFLSVTFGPQLLAAGSALLGLLGPIGISALAVGGLYLVWEKNIGGIRDYVETNFPTVGTAITAVTDTISAAFQGAIDLVVQFKKDLDNLNLFGGSGGEKPANLGEGLKNLPSRLADILTKTVNDGIRAAIDLLLSGKNALEGLEDSGAAGGIGESIGKFLVNLVGSAISSLADEIGKIKDFDEGGAANRAGLATRRALGQFLGAVFSKTTGDAIFTAATATFDVVGTFVSITGQFFAGIAEGISGRVGEILAENEAKLLSISNDISDSITRFLNNIIEQGNKIRTFFGAEAIKKIEIPLELSPTQFKVITPAQVDLSKAIEVTGQVVLDGAQLVRIDEKNKLAIDASVLAQLDPNTKLNLPADSLIEINGAQKLLVDPSQVFQTEAGAQIILSPNDIISIDKSTPVDIGTVDLSAAEVRFESVVTSLSDRLRPTALTLPEVEVPIVPIVETPLTATDITGGTASIIAPVTAEVDQLAAPQVGSDLAAGVTQGYETKIQENGFAPFTEPLNNIIQAMIDKIGARSPATVPKELVGVPIAQGIVLGVTETLQVSQPLVNEALNTLLLSMQTTMLTFQEKTLTNWNLWATNTQTVFTTAYTAISTSTTTWTADILNQYATLRTDLEFTVSAMTGSVVSLFSDMHAAVIAELSAMIRDILTRLDQLIEDIRTKFTEEGEELGHDFAAGIEKGILDYIDEIRKAAATLAEEAVQAAQDALVAESPSQRARMEVGRTFGSGTVLGILDSIPQAISAAQGLVKSMLSSASHTLHDSTEGRYAGATTINNIKHYNLNVQSQQASRGITYDFGIMQLMEGS